MASLAEGWESSDLEKEDNGIGFDISQDFQGRAAAVDFFSSLPITTCQKLLFYACKTEPTDSLLNLVDAHKDVHLAGILGFFVQKTSWLETGNANSPISKERENVRKRARVTAAPFLTSLHNLLAEINVHLLMQQSNFFLIICFWGVC